MSADNRSTHTDALATLGTILTEPQGRDAIHLGVEMVTAGETLERGAPIGFNKHGHAVESWFGAEDKPEYNQVKCVGIVDPFLDKTIYKGQRFWLVVLPRQITSLRHVWEHPDFKPSGETAAPAEDQAEKEHKMRLLLREDRAVAEEVIRTEAKQLGVDRNELMSRAKDYKDNGEYWTEGGRFEGEGIKDTDAFWKAYSLLTGEETENEGNFFSCSC